MLPASPEGPDMADGQGAVGGSPVVEQTLLSTPDFVAAILALPEVALQRLCQPTPIFMHEGSQQTPSPGSGSFNIQLCDTVVTSNTHCHLLAPVTLW